MAAIILNGVTWGHSRGITPLLALSQRYSELYPGVEIKWKKRTLQEFADYPIEELTKDYDLLVIDHPWVGCAAAKQCVLPFDEYLTAAYLEDQSLHSVGASHKSYNYDGRQWALAIDAAAPAASYRSDLLLDHGATIPQTWEELIALAKDGRVALPAIPIDILMNFYTFCLAHKGKLFADTVEVVDRETGIAAIETMKELYSLIDKEMFGFNPIDVAESMSTTNKYWYCPLAYPYSNYAREGYAAHPLRYTNVVSFNGQPLRTTIGGTGLAVSAFTKNAAVAMDFASFSASATCQRTMYVQHGGQPAHRSAWTNELSNRLTNDFFTGVLPTIDNSYMRPRYNGYLHFQDYAGIPLQQCLLHDGNPEGTLDEMNKIYKQSFVNKQSKIIA